MSKEFSENSLFSDANCQAYWKLENTSDSKNSNTLTNVNTVTFTSAKFNNGGNLGTSNTNKYLHTANKMSVTTGAISMGGWIKLTTETTGNSYVLLQHSHSTGGGNDDLMNHVRYEYNGGNRRLRFARYTNAFAGDYHYVSLGTSDFNHFMYVFTGTVVRGYFNGLLVVEASATSTTYTNNSGDGFRIGASRDSSGGASLFSSAIFDDVVVFNRALTSDEVFSIGGTPPSGSSPMFFGGGLTIA